MIIKLLPLSLVVFIICYAASLSSSHDHENKAEILASKKERELLMKLKKNVSSWWEKTQNATGSNLILLYHSIGLELISLCSEITWGKKVIERLSLYLKRTFPSIKGAHVRNLTLMKKLAELYPKQTDGLAALAQLPWVHVVYIITHTETVEEQEFYSTKARKFSWMRHEIKEAIKMRLHAQPDEVIALIEDFHNWKAEGSINQDREAQQ